ncbi:hypothetical protein SteCoe_31692 [Stentor coeruleus]|uniref:Uncharacterized protein n=1 Tax=Stentor coeruleus TaxID=5963 RepID=A0A1R2B0Q1_9CILI|nr:hypothetical protein SteCoe_31692 [Stentor coeruleus]
MSDPLIIISTALVKLTNSLSETISPQEINELKPFAETKTFNELIFLINHKEKDNIIQLLCDLYKNICLNSLIKGQDYAALFAPVMKKENAPAAIENEYECSSNPNLSDFPQEKSSEPSKNLLISPINVKEPINKLPVNSSNNSSLRLIEEKPINISKKSNLPINPNCIEEVKTVYPNPYPPKNPNFPQPHETNSNKSAYKPPVFISKTPSKNLVTIEKSTKIQEKLKPILSLPEPPNIFSIVKLYLLSDYSQELLFKHENKGEWEIDFSSICKFPKIDTDIYIKHHNDKLQLYQTKVESDQDAYYISIERQVIHQNFHFLYGDYKISVSEIEGSDITLFVIRGEIRIGIRLGPNEIPWKDQIEKHFNVKKQEFLVNICMKIKKWFIVNDDSSCVLYRMIHFSEKMNENSQMIMIEENKEIKYRENYIIKLILE